MSAIARSGCVEPTGGGGGGATGGGGGAGAVSPATVKLVVAVWAKVSMRCSSLLTVVFWAITEKVYEPAVTGYVTTPSSSGCRTDGSSFAELAREVGRLVGGVDDRGRVRADEERLDPYGEIGDARAKPAANRKAAPATASTCLIRFCGRVRFNRSMSAPFELRRSLVCGQRLASARGSQGGPGIANRSLRVRRRDPGR